MARTSGLKVLRENVAEKERAVIEAVADFFDLNSRDMPEPLRAAWVGVLEARALLAKAEGVEA